MQKLALKGKRPKQDLLKACFICSKNYANMRQHHRLTSFLKDTTISCYRSTVHRLAHLRCISVTLVGYVSLEKRNTKNPAKIPKLFVCEGILRTNFQLTSKSMYPHHLETSPKVTAYSQSTMKIELMQATNL